MPAIYGEELNREPLPEWLPPASRPRRFAIPWSAAVEPVPREADDLTAAQSIVQAVNDSEQFSRRRESQTSIVE